MVTNVLPWGSINRAEAPSSAKDEQETPGQDMESHESRKVTFVGSREL